MINSSLICFFAIGTIFLIAPSAEAFVNATVKASKKRYVSIDSMDKHVEIINLKDPRHPNAMCKKQLGDNEATWLALELGYLPHDMCTENVLCGVPKSEKIPILLNEKPPEGSQCSANEDDHNFREACEEGMCRTFVAVDIRKVLNKTQS